MRIRFFCAVCAFFPLAFHLFAQTVSETERESDGAGAIVFDTSKLPDFKGTKAVSLFDYDIGDKQVEFLAQGYWQSKITGTSTYTFGFGSTPGFSFSTPVFAQNVDLSLWFMLNKHWYFEANFADQFAKNTVAAGYVGNGIVKSIRIANRGISFPSTYSIDEVNRGIGGGDNQAPGISFHFSDERWQAHAAFRYDMLKSKEKHWYGKNTVSTDTISLKDYQTGNRYILPNAETVRAVTDIFVENNSGSYRDKNGRRYNKLNASQYLLLPSSYSVLLAKDAGAAKKDGSLPAVAIAFSDMTADSVATAAETTIIADVKKWFAKDGVDVTEYFFDVRTDAASSQFVSEIDGDRVLFVQHSAGFSPFTAAHRYDAGITQATNAAVASHRTEIHSSSYTALIGNDELAFVSEDFFYAGHTYVDIYTAEETGSDIRSAEMRFPFADTDAGVYLGYEQKSDLELKIQTYTAVSRLDIGTKAVPGTVRVSKNGILDSGATYDPKSGTITLSSAIAASDHIYATWYEDSESADSGAITAAAGFEYRPTNQVTGDISLATRWTYAGGKKYADSEYTAPGFVTLASRIKYEGKNLTLSNTAAASLESENTTGKFRILGMDEKTNDTFYLAKNAAVNLPENVTPSLNERSPNEKMPSSLGENQSESAEDGSTDSEISGYAIPVSWKKLSNSGKTSGYQWAAISLKFPGNNGNLASASRFSIALKNLNLNNSAMRTPTQFKVYLQLGVLADDDTEKLTQENKSTIPTWLISKALATDENPSDVQSAFVLSDYPADKNGWQTITVMLSEHDRSRLACHHDGRIIICSETDIDAGTILAGPYQADGISFSTGHYAGTTVSSFSKKDSTLRSSKIDDFNTAANYVQCFEWRTFDVSTRTKSEDFDLYASRYFKEIDLQHYEEFSLWFKYNPQNQREIARLTDSSDDALTLTLDRPESGESDAKKAIEITLSKSNLSACAGENWHQLTVDLDSKSVKIDGQNSGTATVNTSVIPVRFKITLNTAKNEVAYYADGEFSVDELTLSGSSPYFVLQDKAMVQWKKSGTVLEKNGYALVKDISTKVTGTGSSTLKTIGNGKNDGVFSSAAEAAVTLTEIKLSGSAAFSTANSHALSSAAHSIQSARPILRVLSFSESYRYSSAEKSLEKTDSAGFDFAGYGVPLSICAQTEAKSDAWAVSQKSSAQAELKNKFIEWNAKAGVEQKKQPSTAGVKILETDSYGQGWIDSTRFAFDTGSEDASNRTILAETKCAVLLPFLNFKPTLTAGTTGRYKSAAQQTFDHDTIFSFEVPFAFKKHAFSLRWEKTGGGTGLTEKGGGYEKDMGDLRSAYRDISWFMKAFPLYDLFSTNLSDEILSKSSGLRDTEQKNTAESLYYTGTYEAIWKRGFYGNKYDLIFPANFSFSLARDIRTADSVSDIYQLKTTISYSALNVFGIEGLIPLATWFNQDKYAASFSATVKIPHNSAKNVSMLYTGYVQANFFVTATNSFKTGFEGSIEDKDNWNCKATVIWKRLSSRSLVTSAIELIRPNYDQSESKLSRTDSLNLATSRSFSSSATEATQKFSAEYAHDLDISVNKYVTLNTGIGGSYACTWNKIITVTATLTLGGTIKF